MKLNQECIRDLLLYFEENLSLENPIIVSEIELKNYSTKELLYTADKLYEAGYIACSRKIYDTVELFIIVFSITYQGHQFLDTIRDNSIWKETKFKASKIASISLPILQELATSLVKAKLGLS